MKPVNYQQLGQAHPKLSRGQVWCTRCDHTEKVDSGEAMRSGWPLHCGLTMTIDSPEERGAKEKR